MRLLAIIPGLFLLVLVLVDVFEVVVLPRRVDRSFRPARYYFRGTWRFWRNAVRRLPERAGNETLLALYGPLSLLGLIAAWAAGMVVAYSVLYWAGGSVASGSATRAAYTTDLYYSGTTFFTLGLGDITPHSGATRAVTVLEVANGFGFLALVIGYLPIFYQTFSRREATIALLDGRAGSPPTAGELLRRLQDDQIELRRTLREYERWAADLLESHLSYAVLMFYRSQHERQSWVATLTAILDTSSIIMVRGTEVDANAAQLTFAMARHAAVDLSDVFERAPAVPEDDRLESDFERLNAMLADVRFLNGEDPRGFQLESLRNTYEPYVAALSRYLLMPLPPWVPEPDAVDAWQTSPVEPSAIGLADPIPDRAVRAGRPPR